LHLLLHSLKKEDDLDVRQVLFNSLVAITGNATLKIVAQAAGTDLGRGIDLIRAKLDEIIMDRFDFSGIDLTDASIGRSSAIGAKFVGAKLWKARIMHTNFQDADFTNAELWDATFEHVDLKRTLLHTDYVNHNTWFRDSDTEGATWSKRIHERLTTS
jgi:uncharacterized protein YjbI with pentapeptide repeats